MVHARVAEVDCVNLVALWNGVDVEIRPAELHETSNPDIVGVIGGKHVACFQSGRIFRKGLNGSHKARLERYLVGEAVGVI
jgi:hypothetical protein